MSLVNSVLGPMDTANLGVTLSHEHVLVSSAGIQYVYPEFIDRDGTIASGVADLKEALGEGLQTIVDVTTMDLGRDIRLLEQVSRDSGVNIICATGIWRDIPRAFGAADPDMSFPSPVGTLWQLVDSRFFSLCSHRAAVSTAFLTELSIGPHCGDENGSNCGLVDSLNPPHINTCVGNAPVTERPPPALRLTGLARPC